MEHEKSGQTMTLAQNTPGRNNGLDLFPDFIRYSTGNAERDTLQIGKGIVGSMDNLPFENESLDLRFGRKEPIYNIGMNIMIERMEKVSKQGYMAASGRSWFTDERATEINDFWMEHYKGNRYHSNGFAQMQKAGYIQFYTSKPVGQIISMLPK